MNGNFKVGEVLVIHSLTLSADLNGMECIVKSNAQYGQGVSRETGLVMPASWFHRVEIFNGLVMCIPIINLRRKQPPAGEASILNMFVVAPPKRIKEPA